MNGLQIFYTILTFLGGVGVFIFSMKLMSEGLEKSAGDKMRVLLSKVSSNRFAGVGIGAGVTALIQSSSASTVMVVGFVNVGVMTLQQATAIIMGANIGTTITAQIAALSAFKSVFDVTAIASAIAAIGVVMVVFFKSTKVQQIGSIFAGLGMLFIGLDLMTETMYVFAEQPAFVSMMLQFTNPVLLLLTSMLITAIIQSSSVVTGILVSMIATGVLTLESAMFLILGSNIGTCITALLSSIGTKPNAKRAAIIHLMFNLCGTLIVIFPLLFFTRPIAEVFRTLFSQPQMQVAWFHTCFNVLTTLILLPFINVLVRVSCKIIPNHEKNKPLSMDKLSYLDDRLLQTPSIAVAQINKEVINMAAIAKANLSLSMDNLIAGQVRDRLELDEREKHINMLNRTLSKFLVRISSMDISYDDEVYIGSLYHVISDIERIGDLAENVFEYGEEMVNAHLNFSPEAVSEIQEMWKLVEAMYDEAVMIFNDRNIRLFNSLNDKEELVDAMKDKMRENHMKRLETDACNALAGTVYLSLASDLERVADHLTNIAYSIKDYTKQSKQEAVPAME